MLYQTVSFVCIPQLPHSLFLQCRNNNGRKTGDVLGKKKRAFFPKVTNNVNVNPHAFLNVSFLKDLFRNDSALL